MFSHSVILYRIKSYLSTGSELNDKDRVNSPNYVVTPLEVLAYGDVNLTRKKTNAGVLPLASRLYQCSTIQLPHAYRANAGDIVIVFCFLVQVGLVLRHYTYHVFRILNSRRMCMSAKLATLLLFTVYILFTFDRDVYLTRTLHDLGKRRKGTKVLRVWKEIRQ